MEIFEKLAEEAANERAPEKDCRKADQNADL